MRTIPRTTTPNATRTLTSRTVSASGKSARRTYTLTPLNSDTPSLEWAQQDAPQCD